MKQFKKKNLGKKCGTTYLCGLFSIKKYEHGWVIKPVKSEPILISKVMGYILAGHIRNKNELYTMNEAKKVMGFKMAKEI